MTDRDLHLDDETISAAIDGEDVHDGARAHLDACAMCRARLESFRHVASVITTPVPPAPSAARDAAIAAAIETPLPGASSDRRVRAGPWLAVAAVIVLLLAAVPVIAALSSGRDTNDAATSARDDAGSSAGAPGKSVRPLADLGALDVGNLAGVVGREVGASAAALSAPSAPSGGAPAPTRDDSTASASQRASDEGAGGAAGGATGESLAADAGRACESSLHASGAQVLVARGLWDDRPAVVFAYRTGDDVTAYVVNPADCRILHFVRFRAGS